MYTTAYRHASFIACLHAQFFGNVLQMENKEKMSKKLSEIFENHFIQYDLKFGVKMRVFKLIEGLSLTA